MEIVKNKIKYANTRMDFGSNFQTVYEIVKDSVMYYKNTDSNGYGHIVVDRVSFYGLYGNCCFKFKDHKLYQFSLIPNLDYYINLRNNNKQMLENMKEVIMQSINGLNKNFKITKNTNNTYCYVADKIKIAAITSNEKENYLIVVNYSE